MAKTSTIRGVRSRQVRRLAAHLSSSPSSRDAHLLRMITPTHLAIAARLQELYPVRGKKAWMDAKTWPGRWLSRPKPLATILRTLERWDAENSKATTTSHGETKQDDTSCHKPHAASSLRRPSTWLQVVVIQP